MKERILSIVESFGNDAGRMMDILLGVQAEFGCVSDEAVSAIASALHISEVDVIQVRSFYHFFTCKPVGKYAVYLNNSVVSQMMGMADVADEFEKLTGVKFGSSTPDGQIGLRYTACIGMSDQEPAALINSVVFTSLTRDKVRQLVADMRAGKAVGEMFTQLGDGQNANPLVKAMVNNNIRKTGAVTLGEYTLGKGLEKALKMDGKGVISEVKESNLRGRGGAGFPTGMKWDFCSRETGDHYVLCNADEGEPGTFKDRVLLTERAHMLFEGMTIGGYAIGAKQGVLYLRNEYTYLKAYLESVLKELRTKDLLGNNILGRGFDFDIRIQFGAGAYVCGEESALIESCEGKRGEPRNRPPFPVQKGYKAKPTIVNNVETFCSAVKILEKGGAWYNNMGTSESAGTKLLSISGDCKFPGVYEIEWGMSIREMLKMVGAENVQAVQVAGPSGVCLNPAQFDRKIALEDLPTGGSMTVIGYHRDLLKEVVVNFMHFFADESCGSCVTCRSFNTILKNAIEKVVAGKAIKKDLDDMIAWSEILRKTTRCGLGQTSSNPITTTITNFRDLYDLRVSNVDFKSDFDLQKSVLESCEVVKRSSQIHE
jgi:[NiFe] hydrogenase diaphorase moiety large subunit